MSIYYLDSKHSKNYLVFGFKKYFHRHNKVINVLLFISIVQRKPGKEKFPKGFIKIVNLCF